jgi:putative ABC transport system substrate-binding protein
MISRRELLLQGAPAFAVLWPLRAAAQQEGKIYRIGLLLTAPIQPGSAYRVMFIAALRDLGYVEGRNLVIEVRSADNKPERLPALATELAQLNLDVIVTKGDGEVRAAKLATRTIPIVMDPSGDPVAAGYIASLARPGGNVTGLSFVSPDLSAKLLQVLKEATPNVVRIAVLWNAANPVKVLDFSRTQRAAQALGLTLQSIEMRSPLEMEAAFAAISAAHSDALLTLVDDIFGPTMFVRIAAFALKRRLPSILGEEHYATAGGLIAYGPSMRDLEPRAAAYVDKILKGAKPADLPVEQPTKFHLVINLKTAKALGLTIPPSLLQRADQVIE